MHPAGLQTHISTVDMLTREGGWYSRAVPGLILHALDDSLWHCLASTLALTPIPLLASSQAQWS